MDDKSRIEVDEVKFYDERELFYHCTVQLLGDDGEVVEEHTPCTVEIYRNSETGEESYGWWEETDGDVWTETETAEAE